MPKIVKTCEYCDEPFEVWPSRAGTAKTCSKSCFGKLAALKYRKSWLSKDCDFCGKLFSFPKIQEGRRKCCSYECAAEIDRLRHHSTDEDCYNWKGGKTKHSDGYIYVYAKGHPLANHGPYVLEHRLVIEGWMRNEDPSHNFLMWIEGTLYLRPKIKVHHIDEDKSNNKPENLLACTSASHHLIHAGKPPMKGQTWPEVEGSVPPMPMLVDLSCERCNKAFTKKRSDVARGAGRFCSRACYLDRMKP
jgi:hypothetical protein